MDIRIAIEKDLPQINDIYNQAVQQKFCTAHLYPVSLSEHKVWFEAHDSGRFPVFVAENDDRICGWTSLGPYRADRQALDHVAEMSYYVDSGERGKGLGSQLLEHTIGAAPDYGFSVLIAILLSKNQASIELLRKFGFEEWGSMPGIALIGDQHADHLYYGRKL